MPMIIGDGKVKQKFEHQYILLKVPLFAFGMFKSYVISTCFLCMFWQKQFGCLVENVFLLSIDMFNRVFPQNVFLSSFGMFSLCVNSKCFSFCHLSCSIWVFIENVFLLSFCMFNLGVHSKCFPFVIWHVQFGC